MDTIATALEQATLLVVRQLIDRRELSLTASDVLHQLDTDGPARLSVLAAGAGLSQPSMTQLIQRFERRGMVSRTADPSDRRAILIAITETGRDVVRRRRCCVRERLDDLLTTLLPDEQAALELAATVTLPLISRLNGAQPLEHTHRSSA